LALVGEQSWDAVTLLARSVAFAAEE